MIKVNSQSEWNIDDPFKFPAMGKQPNDIQPIDDNTAGRIISTDYTEMIRIPL
jgi:hypothetical protein